MKNLSRKDDLGLMGQGMGETPRTDELHNKLAQDLDGSDLYRYHKMKWLSEEIERELNQAIRERDQARSNVKPMGEVTIARNGYIQEVEAQRDQAQSALRTLLALHEREIETGEPITGEDWEIAGYGLGDE